MLNFINKKILIYGLGISGISSFKFLKNKNFVKLFDDNQKKIYKLNKKNIINKKRILLNNFDYILLSPGINLANCSLKNYLIKNKDKIITDLDVFYSCYKNNKKITITGTNGKSTTAKLTYDIFKKLNYDVRLIGNIGKPSLSEKKIKAKTIFIIEASSYQLEYSKYFISDISVITNISPDHLERHGTFSKYINSKFKLIKAQNSNGISIIGKNNNRVEKLISNNNIKGKIIKIRNNLNPKIFNKIKNPYFKINNNLQNLSFAIEISKLFKIKFGEIVNVVNNFNPLKYRQEIKINNNKIIVINDSKSTSFSSSIPLLENYKNIYWIVGGTPKKGDKFSLKKKFFKNIKAYIIGKYPDFFKKKLKSKIYYKESKTIKNALINIINDSKNNKFKTIIFSPAAASFDQFLNFEDRGYKFDIAIKKFIKNDI